MSAMRQVFLGMILSNFLALFFLGLSYLRTKSTQPHHALIPQLKETMNNINLKAHEVEEPLKFDNPFLAFDVLLQLDYLEKSTPYLERRLQSTKRTAYFGFTSDEDYCHKHLAHFVANPDFIFNQKNFVMDYAKSMLPRDKVARVIGNDVHPNAGWHMAPQKKAKLETDIRPDVNIFFTNGGMHGQRVLGRQFGCLTQIYNHIFGRESINRKDNAAEAVVNYARKFESRPHCFNFDKFFPKTWVLRHASQCRDFFENHFQGPEYERLKAERTIVYIRKVGAGSHQAKGVQPVNDAEEQALRRKYRDGKACGQLHSSTIIQQYVYNPLLLNGHKFDFRIYMVVGSTNPTMVYYHDGFLRVSLHPYNVSSNDKSVLLTNTALSSKIFDIARKKGHYQGLNETELRNFQMWNFERLQAYLLEKKMINSTNWLDEYLRPEFKKAMVHLVRMGVDSFVKKSQMYELFGCDFMLDSNLNLWFIECNSGPVLSGSSKEKEKFVSKMLADQFEIAFAMLKSRSKRIIKFVNEMIRSKEAQRLENGEVAIKDLEQKKEEFKRITQNYLEPEYELSPDNGFFKIYDGYLEGTERYAGLIPEECI